MKSTFFKTLALLTIFAYLVCAEPVSLNEAETAVKTFVSLRYPLADQAAKNIVTPVGSSSMDFTKIEPWVDSGKIIGFVAELKPTGFVLMRADTLCPPTKLYYDKGKFSDLPPDFIEVIKWELKQELQYLSEATTKKKSLNFQFETDWSALINPMVQDNALSQYSGADTITGPLLSLTWNQNSPYNYYAPAAAGGPGGRAYAGCVATAMSQIMRHHKSPTAIAGDYTYTDNSGNCQGTHSVSDAGLGDYQWSDMPNSINDAGPTSQKQAVGQLIYHAGVTMNMNFEATGSGAFSENVPAALRTYFGYSSGNLKYRSNYSDSEWYTRLYTDINNSRPVYYAFRNDLNQGHAVVCDGTRNDNEIHINFGWSGSANAWYNMNSVGDWNYTHRAIFEIYPSGGGGDTFSILKLKGKVDWKKNPGYGSDTILCKIPCSLTDLLFLEDCGNISEFLIFDGGAGRVSGSAGSFKSMNKKGTVVNLQYKSTIGKYQVKTKLKLKNGYLYAMRKMKNGNNSDTKFNVRNSDSGGWQQKQIDVEVNLTYGSVSVQGKDTTTVQYKTIADKKTQIK